MMTIIYGDDDTLLTGVGNGVCDDSEDGVVLVTSVGECF